jgi:hypothetical protein
VVIGAVRMALDEEVAARALFASSSSSWASSCCGSLALGALLGERRIRIYRDGRIESAVEMDAGGCGLRNALRRPRSPQPRW